MTQEEIQGKLDIINTVLHKYRHHVCVCNYGEHFSVWGCLPNDEGYLLDKSLQLYEFSTYQSFKEWYYRFLRDQRESDKRRKRRIDQQNKRIALHNRVKDALKAKGMCIISYFDGHNLVHCIYECAEEHTRDPHQFPMKSLSGDTALETWFNEWLERHR